MFENNTMHHWLLADLTCKSFKHAHYGRLLNAWLVQYSVEKFQFLAFIVETLYLISIVHFNHELNVSLKLNHLIEADTFRLSLAKRNSKYVWCWPLKLVTWRHILRGWIQKSFALENSSFLNNCSDIVIIDFVLWELHCSDTTALPNNFFRAREVLVSLVLI